MPDAESARTAIMVVDDEKSIRTILCNVLAKIPGCQVDAAEDGQKAIERLRAEKFARDLVVTDIQMPHMNGEELIMAIRAECPLLPIIVLTAHKDDRRIVRCLEMGTLEYVLKPIKVDKFLQTVQRALDRARRLPEKSEDLRVHSEIPGWVEITAPTDFEYVERFQKFTSLLGDIPLSDESREDIRMAIDELGQNAVEWGNRYDRQKLIHLAYCIFHDRIVFKIEDEGEGFDPAVLGDPSADPLAHIIERMKSGKRAGGYGVYLTRKIMDDIVYNQKGNVVLLTKYFTPRRKDG